QGSIDRRAHGSPQGKRVSWGERLRTIPHHLPRNGAHLSLTRNQLDKKGRGIFCPSWLLKQIRDLFGVKRYLDIYRFKGIYFLLVCPRTTFNQRPGMAHRAAFGCGSPGDKGNDWLGHVIADK